MVDKVLLERFAYTPMGTFGRLMFPEFQCFTVERPWFDNKVRESCIPEGEYNLRLGRYHKGGYDAYEILDVPERTLIKIHVGNTIDDVIGCVAPGKSLGTIYGKWGVTSSKAAFQDFMTSMDGVAESTIEISFFRP
jgi:hypothetical protein